MFNKSVGYEGTKSIYFKQPQFGQVVRMIEICLKNICTSGNKVFLDLKEVVSSFNELSCQYTLDKIKRKLIGSLTGKITTIMLKLTSWSLL